VTVPPLACRRGRTVEYRHRRPEQRGDQPEPREYLLAQLNADDHDAGPHEQERHGDPQAPPS